MRATDAQTKSDSKRPEFYYQQKDQYQNKTISKRPFQAQVMKSQKDVKTIPLSEVNK